MKNKKITVISLITVLIFSLGLFAGCTNKKEEAKKLTKVKIKRSGSFCFLCSYVCSYK